MVYIRWFVEGGWGVGRWMVFIEFCRKEFWAVVIVMIFIFFNMGYFFRDVFILGIYYDWR